jgi:hypothetical protein
MIPAAVSPHASGQSTKIQRVTLRAVPCRAVGTVSAQTSLLLGPK